MSIHAEERTFREWVWCARYYRCGGIGDPGYVGGGRPELCVACEATELELLARAGEGGANDDTVGRTDEPQPSGRGVPNLPG